MCSKLDSFHREHEIIFQFFTLGATMQNGMKERRNQILIGIVRWVIGFSSFLIFFWGYVLKTVLYFPYLIPFL